MKRLTMAFLFRGAQHSKIYQKYRPEYPPSVYTTILKHLDGEQLTSSGSNRRDTAFDLGCGTGISTLPLVEHFKKVVGVDVSESQIDEARKMGAAHGGLSYRVSSAHDLSFQEDGGVDLITIAQALHWMDTKVFYPECHRILRPGGVLAAYGYGVPRVTNDEAQKVVRHFHDIVLEEYWDPGRKHIGDCYQELYKDFSAAFPISERDDSLALVKTYSLDDFIGYLQSWSAYQIYMSRNSDAEDPLKDVASRLTAILSKSCEADGAGDAKNGIRFSVISPIFILFGRKN